MSAVVASRTPEGVPGKCPVCGARVFVEPTRPAGDAPCPRCGCLIWFAALVEIHEPPDDFVSSTTSAETLWKLSMVQSAYQFGRVATRRAGRARQTPRTWLSFRHLEFPSRPFSRTVTRAAAWVRSVFATAKSGAGPGSSEPPSYGDVWDPWLDS